jgi:hypothetical protein
MRASAEELIEGPGNVWLETNDDSRQQIHPSQDYLDRLITRTARKSILTFFPRFNHHVMQQNSNHWNDLNNSSDPNDINSIPRHVEGRQQHLFSGGSNAAVGVEEDVKENEEEEHQQHEDAQEDIHLLARIHFQ